METPIIYSIRLHASDCSSTPAGQGRKSIPCGSRSVRGKFASSALSRRRIRPLGLLAVAATESTEEQREQAPPPGFGPFQRRSRAPMPTVRLGCLREAGPTGRTTDRPPLCAEAPDQRCTLGV